MAKLVITQTKLVEFSLAEQRRLEAGRVQSALERECAKLRAELLAAFKDGAKIEAGTLSLKLAEGGRYPPWKQLFIDRLGEAAAKEAEEATPRKETLEIVIAEQSSSLSPAPSSSRQRKGRTAATA